MHDEMRVAHPRENETRNIIYLKSRETTTLMKSQEPIAHSYDSYKCVVVCSDKSENSQAKLNCHDFCCYLFFTMGHCED